MTVSIVHIEILSICSYIHCVLMYIDIDECEQNLASCVQGCDNLVGSFSCYCHSGFYPALDGASCISELDTYCVCDISECT